MLRTRERWYGPVYVALFRGPDGGGLIVRLHAPRRVRGLALGSFEVDR